jgi:hypothetical protein
VVLKLLTDEGPLGILEVTCMVFPIVTLLGFWINLNFFAIL